MSAFMTRSYRRSVGPGHADILRGKGLQYERNEALEPIVYRLSDKACRAATLLRIRAESI
jgi:hypothetical protein